jgi:16S rRNA (guanine527-N7)-methyltransferase
VAQRSHAPDIEDRFRALKERWGLPDGAVARLRRLHRLLVEDPLAPTAVRDPAKAIDDHLADALVGLDLDEVRTAGTLADLGSGAGVPGLPLAIALPGTSVTLVDSLARRCAFLERAVAEADVPNAQVVNTRFESWSEGLTRFDVATARALAPLPVVVEYAAPLLVRGGTLVIWRGRRDPAAEEAAARAAAEVGLDPVGILSVRPYPTAQDRHLHLMSKVMDTPPGFPRRPGMALKRPLGVR